MKEKELSLKELLNHLLTETKGQDVSISVILESLAGKGKAVLLIILALPFCQPILIPGFSVPFGITLMFLGFRISFGHHLWIPQRILVKKISHETVEKLAKATIRIIEKLSIFTSTRWLYLVNTPALHMVHGLTIAVLGFLLALPLPIPFTNLLAAYPILFFGLGLLEDDGVMILIAYILCSICFSAFFFLLILGNGFLNSF